jgi:integrase
VSRSYKNIRPKKYFVYTVDGLIRLFGIHRNTVSNWVAEGLRTSDTLQPHVFNGIEVKRFHRARRLNSTAKLRIGELNCFRCKKRGFPNPSSVSVLPSKHGFLGVWGACPNCGCVVTKRVNETNCDKIQNCVDTNTTLASLDEEYDPVLVGIGKDRPSEDEVWYCANDRTMHAWLQFAGRWDRKTISAKLAAVRQFEAFFQGKSFEKITTADVTGFRESLKSSVEASADDRRSISTARHCASHLKSFFEWLVDQKGFQGLNKSLPDHFILPRKFEANGLARPDRPCPNDEDAVAMVKQMPTDTLIARRNRAMVAIAFLAALRADTVTSLRLKHLEVSKRVVIQDAKISRTKNGKSLRINWFPLPPIFAEVVEDWLNELVALGFYQDDALFPDERCLQKRHFLPQSEKIPVMSSTHAIAQAFSCASALVGKKFSPHSAKHYIGALGMKRCNTIEEQAAWSANMGHEDKEITKRYYQKLPQNLVDDVFERFDQGDDSNILHDDMLLMLRYHAHSLVKGTPEFERAKKLVSEFSENGTFE